MATNSALAIVTGIVDGKSIRNTIDMPGHGFTAGQALRWQVEDATPGFTAAIATSPENAEVSGVIERIIDDNTFVLVYQGECKLNEFTTIRQHSGVTGEEVYFLSAITAGYLDPTPPTSGGHVIKPLITRRGTLTGSSTQRGLVMNYLGTVIGGEATVSLNGLMPVGMIQAYAGSSAGIPSGWSICDGATLDSIRHAEYYTAVGTEYGHWQKVTLPWVNTVEGNDLNGQELKQVYEDTTTGDFITVTGTIVTWNNDSKEVIVDVHTHDSFGNLITDNSTKGDEFLVSVAGANAPGIVVSVGGTNQVATDEVPQPISAVSAYAVKKPDMRGRFAVGQGSTGAAELAMFRRGSFGGEETHTLTISELPSHDHDSTQNTNTIVVPSSTHNISGSGTLTLTTSAGGLHRHFVALMMNNEDGTGRRFRASPNHDLTSTSLVNSQLNPLPKYCFDNDDGDMETIITSSHWNSTADDLPDGVNTSGYTENNMVTINQAEPNAAPSSSSGAHTHTSTLNISDVANNLSDITIPEKEIDITGLVTVSPEGDDQPHNNMPPYVTTNYIIRISSEARAALIDNLNVDLAMEGLNNVNAGSPTDTEMVRYDGTNAEYEKFYPVIHGMGSKDNNDVVIHTSQSAAGATIEAMRIDTKGRVLVGVTQGVTGGGGVDNPMWMTDYHTAYFRSPVAGNEASYAFFQGSDSTQYGATGTMFGHKEGQSVIWNHAPDAAGTLTSRYIGFYFANASRAGSRYHRMHHWGLGIGGNELRSGASLDVQGGNLAVKGDIYTYGGTYGVYVGGTLGISGEHGYVFPTAAGNSGDILMLTDDSFEDRGITEAHWVPFPSFNQYWTGTRAKGISFEANVGVATGGNGTVFGATLEVGGFTRVHERVLAEQFYAGTANSGSVDHDVQTALFSGLTSSAAAGYIKSSASHAYWVANAATDMDSGYFCQINGANKGLIAVGAVANERLSIGTYPSSSHKSVIQANQSSFMSLGDAVTPSTKYAVLVGTNTTGRVPFAVEGEGTKGVAAVIYNGTAGYNDGNSAAIQLFQTNNAFIQIGTTGSPAGGVHNSNFGDTAGFFLGITGSNHAQIKHIGAGGGTLDLIVGSSAGNTLAMMIHQSGAVQIGGTAGGGYPINGTSLTGGLAVVDYTGSTGNSGDVLTNVDNTGLTRWSPTVGNYGKSVVDAKSSAFFYDQASGGSQIAVAMNDTFYYQSTQGRPIMVSLVLNDGNYSEGPKDITYTDPNGTSVVVGGWQKTGNGGFGDMRCQCTWAMYPGSSFTIPSTSKGFTVRSCAVFKQE